MSPRSAGACAEHRWRTGFTLLEMLITIAIMSMLITAAVQAFQSIIRAEERARAGVGRSRSARVLLDRIERELVGTLLVPRPQGEEPGAQPYVFLGEPHTSDNLDAHALQFVTLTASRAPNSAWAGGPRVVSYAIREADPDEFEELDHGTLLELLRGEEPLSEETEPELGVREGQIVAEAIAGFRLRFQDESDEAWVDRWDSTEPPHIDELPLSVEVGVMLWERDPDGRLVAGPEHIRRVELRMRPTDFVPPEARLEEVCGKTVGQCWRENIAEAIDPESADGRRLQSLYERIPASLCWNDFDEELSALKTALAELDAEAARDCE